MLFLWVQTFNIVGGNKKTLCICKVQMGRMGKKKLYK